MKPKEVMSCCLVLSTLGNVVTSPFSLTSQKDPHTHTAPSALACGLDIVPLKRLMGRTEVSPSSFSLEYQ